MKSNADVGKLSSIFMRPNAIHAFFFFKILWIKGDVYMTYFLKNIQMHASHGWHWLVMIWMQCACKLVPGSNLGVTLVKSGRKQLYKFVVFTTKYMEINLEDFGRRTRRSRSFVYMVIIIVYTWKRNCLSVHAATFCIWLNLILGETLIDSKERNITNIGLAYS